MSHTTGPSGQSIPSRTDVCLSTLLSSVQSSFQADPSQVLAETAAPGPHLTDPASPRKGPRLSSLFLQRSQDQPTLDWCLHLKYIRRMGLTDWPVLGQVIISGAGVRADSSSLHLGLDRMAQDKFPSLSEGLCTPWVFQDPKMSQVHSKTWANHGLLLFSHSALSDSLWPHGLQHLRLPCPSLSPGVCSNSCPSSQWCHPTISFSFDLSQHQGLFQWVGSLHQVAKILELQLHHQSFQWILGLISFRID